MKIAIHKKISVICLSLLSLAALFVGAFPAAAATKDAVLLDKLQRDTFLYMWEKADPESGMAVENIGGKYPGPVAVGGSGFGIAAIVVATDRGWISQDEAVDRLLRITRFLRDKASRPELRGAFPHWVDGRTGDPQAFGQKDVGADIVETSFLMQGLLIARAYFNGPGNEEELRSIITQLWEQVDWEWFTAGEKGLHWHFTPQFGHSGMRILGYNECMITYVLAISSPRHPISREAYDYWTSGDGYKPKKVYGYDIQAALPGAGPLFLTHYSFIGLDPRRMADSFVPNGYFTRNAKHVLSNRGYCLQNAPAKNRYGENFWGLTASRTKSGYAAGEPFKDTGTVAPTAALSSMPYAPHYSMQVLENMLGSGSTLAALAFPIWGPYGPYDGISLRDNWVSEEYLAIDQLPIVCMVENYRSGLLWNLFMSDPDVRSGLQKAGITEPQLEQGFPEAVVTLKKVKNKYVPDAYDIRQHPDSGLYVVPFWRDQAGKVSFTLADAGETVLKTWEMEAAKGRNHLYFEPFERKTDAGTSTEQATVVGKDGKGGKKPAKKGKTGKNVKNTAEAANDASVLSLIMRDAAGGEYRLPVRLH